MSSGLIRFAVASFLAVAAAGPLAPASPSRRPAAPSAPAAPATLHRRRLSPRPAPAPKPRRSAFRDDPAPAAPGPAHPADAAPPGEGAPGETVDLKARPFAYIEGKADKDEIYSAILASLGGVKGELDKAKLAPAGRPIAVFVGSDDAGFNYHAGYPLAAAPEGKTSLSDTVKIGETPSGKAMRFVHQGAYGDIDATYDAITAYLDDKGIDAQDTFVEEYANDVKDPADPNLQVNIYVLLK